MLYNCCGTRFIFCFCVGTIAAQNVTLNLKNFPWQNTEHNSAAYRVGIFSLICVVLCVHDSGNAVPPCAAHTLYKMSTLKKTAAWNKSSVRTLLLLLPPSTNRWFYLFSDIYYYCKNYSKSTTHPSQTNIQTTHTSNNMKNRWLITYSIIIMLMTNLVIFVVIHVSLIWRRGAVPQLSTGRIHFVFQYTF